MPQKQERLWETDKDDLQVSPYLAFRPEMPTDKQPPQEMPSVRDPGSLHDANLGENGFIGARKMGKRATSGRAFDWTELKRDQDVCPTVLTAKKQ
ncbi:MAG: hypothetical protein Q9209_003184 [Squamulea sp. 1 TL-2023]